MTMRFLSCFVLTCLFLAPKAEAGKVVKTSGKKVFIKFDTTEGGTFAVGDIFTIADANGKKIGNVELKKVKGLKAIGLLKKGAANKGNTASFKSEGKKKSKKIVGNSNSPSSPSSSPSGDDSSSYSKPMSSKWGAVFGYGMAKQTVDQGASVSDQSGSSLAVKGVYDYPILETLNLRAMFGMEMFTVSGEGRPIDSPSTTATIDTKVNYISLDLLLTWFVSRGKSADLYLLAGPAILYPMSKSSTSIVEESIESIGILEVGAGFQFKFGTWTIPIDVSYYYFPSGEDVKTSVISIKGGVLF